MIDSLKNFFSDWWRSRDWGLFRFGLFALIGGLALLVLLMFAELQSSWDRSGQYLGVARHARAEGDLEAASIFYEKALMERTDDEAALFEWAAVSDELGEYSSRDATLRYLVQEASYLPAMLYSGGLALKDGRVDEAKEILEASVGMIPEGEREEGSVLVASADDLRRGLVRARWQDGAFQEAIEEGSQLLRPALRDEMDLSVLHLRAGELEEARRRAAGVLGRLGSVEDQPDADVLCALAESVMGKGIEARRRLARASRGGGAARLILEAQVRCFELLRVSSETMPDLGLLESAALAGLPTVVGPVVEMTLDEHLIEEADLVEAMVGGKAPFVGHLLVGLGALKDGKLEDARLHFEVASELSRAGGTVLGWCGLRLAILEGRESDALFLANMVTSFIPGSDGIFMRGKILLALGKTAEIDALLRDETLPTEGKAAFREEMKAFGGMGRKTGN